MCDRVSSWIQTKIIINGGPVVFDGHEILFPRNVGVGMATDIYWSHGVGYEEETWSVLKQITQNATSFIDVGSHIGLFSVAIHRAHPRRAKNAVIAARFSSVPINPVNASSSSVRARRRCHCPKVI